ncbi:MAG: hypothetical protein JJ895_04870 [Balneolaceae bacterium]|nr:hypothetical protein [Balneolaceae bacterium]
MSDTGLNATIYYLTSKYLEIINDFLIAIQDDAEKLSVEQLNEIKELIENLQDEEIIDTRIQTLSVIIESQLRENRLSPKQFYSTLNENLDERRYEALAKNLDHVIIALDNEYSHALAKMKQV